MTPIHPKDRPKVIAMSILSVFMLGFFLMSLLGAVSKRNAAQAAAQRPTAAGPAPVPAPVAPAPVPDPSVVASVAPFGKPVGAPDAVPGAVRIGEGSGIVDPFRHVLPDPATLQRLMADANRPPAPKMKMPSTLTGALPAGPIGGGVTVSAVVPPDPTIRLDGVVTDHDRYAMVTFHDRTDMYHVGSRIAGLFTVVGVTGEGASFRGPKGIFRLDVGEERSATAPVPKEAKGLTPGKAVAPRRTDARPQELAQYTVLPMPSFEGPAAGRGH